MQTANPETLTNQLIEYSYEGSHANCFRKVTSNWHSSHTWKLPARWIVKYQFVSYFLVEFKCSFVTKATQRDCSQSLTKDREVWFHARKYPLMDHSHGWVSLLNSNFARNCHLNDLKLPTIELINSWLDTKDANASYLISFLFGRKPYCFKFCPNLAGEWYT